MIFGADDRIKVPTYLAGSTGSYVQIISTYADGYRTQSSGTLISSNDVLTAAHVMYDSNHGGYAADVVVTPSRFGDIFPYNSTHSNALYVSEGWISSASSLGDYGVISLVDPIGFESGWMQYDNIESLSGVLGYSLTSYGYPSDRDNGAWLYQTSGVPEDIFNNYMLRFRDGFDTYYGQSGSPVQISDTVIGVVTSQSQSHNYILALNQLSSDQIGTWEQQNNHQLSADSIELTLEESIAALYIAFFDRAPDYSGLNFWLKSAASFSSQNAITKTIASLFATEEVFTSLYVHLDNREYIEAIYKNILGNSADESGIVFWTGYLDEGYSRAFVVDDIVFSALTVVLESAPFDYLSYSDYKAASIRQEIFRNKLDTSLYYTHTLKSQSDIINLDYPQTDPAYIASAEILSNITEDYASVIAAKTYIEQTHVWLS